MNQLRKIIGLTLLLTVMMLMFCACSGHKTSDRSAEGITTEDPTDERTEEDPSSSSQIQESPKGRLSNPYAKNETVEINTEERSWYNFARGTTTTYGAAQLKLSIVEDLFSLSGRVSDSDGKERDDSCAMVGICVEAVSLPDEVDYITFSDYIKSLHFLTSDKSEVTPVFYWIASYDAYSDIYTEAKRDGHIHYNYYVDIDYAEQKLYEGGKLYLLLGGLCATDFEVSSINDLDYLIITYNDKDSNPVSVYQSLK